MIRANPRADAPTRVADYPFAVGGESFIPAGLPAVSARAPTQVAVFTYNFGGNVRPGSLSVRGEIVGTDGQPRVVPLAIGRESGVERGGGRKLMLTLPRKG
jgi:hypothetical protein